MEQYNEILKIGIGKVTAKASIDNYFPIIGESIKVSAETVWGQTSEWETQSSLDSSNTSNGNLVKQKDSKTISISGYGELKQKFIARNSVSEVEVVKTAYAMEKQLLPYFVVTLDEVVRVGEPGVIRIDPENGYEGTFTAIMRIYKENNSNIYKQVSFIGGTHANYLFNEFSERGVYDVEVEVTDIETGTSLTKKHNKFITVIPKLCPKPTDINSGYEVAFTYEAYTSYISLPGTKTFECRLWRNVNNSGLNYAEMILPKGNPNNGQWNGPDCSSLPEGTTLVIKRDPEEPEEYPMRLFLKGNKDISQTNENGTPNFSYEKPLVITHDEEGIMNWKWRAYGAFSPGGNMRNVVIDGYGYNKTGILFTPFEESMFTDSCLFINNGSSDFEIYGVDINGAGFAGISAKTDPNPNMPWFWRENGWEMKLIIHHCKFRNTVGEGVYIGYFDTSEKQGNNINGEIVRYHAHIIRDLKLYRCEFFQNGYDSVQINNACGVEFCYNILDGCGYRREPSQGSAFSCTMDGKIYNCIVKNNYNIIGVFGPFLSGLEIFNCVLTAAKLEPGWVLTAWTTDQNPQEVISGKYYKIYNNIVKAATIARLTGNVSYTGYEMNDNIFITENGDTETPGYFSGRGNIFLKADLDYENIDSQLKVADSANYNYQPAYNAQSITSGKSSGVQFDMRGYKNWYIGKFHSGPFMGKYKDTSIQDLSLSLNRILINSGLQITQERDVKIDLYFSGTATHYRLSESSNFNGADWIEIPEEGDITFTLSEGFILKTVYAQVKNSLEESEVVSGEILLIKKPISLTMTINEGKKFTTSRNVFVKLSVDGSYENLSVRLSEYSNFDHSISFPTYTSGENIEFELSEEKGEKTIFSEVKSETGEISIASSTINFVSTKSIISFSSYGASERGFDEINCITKPGLWPINWDIFDVTGAKMGRITIKSVQGWGDLKNQWGVTSTGNNSGAYPDSYLLRGTVRQQTLENVTNNSMIEISGLAQGNYTLRTLNNAFANWGNIESTTGAYLIVQGQQHIFADLGVENFRDNWNNLAELKNIIVGEDGLLNFTIAATNGHTHWGVPLNVIEIEKE